MESVLIADKEKDSQYLFTNSDTYAATTIQVEDAYDSDINTAVVISDIKKNKAVAADSISKLINDDNESILLSETQKKVTDSIVTPVVKEKEQEPLLQREEKTILETRTEEPVVVTKVKQTTPNKTLNCVIVVGVFKDVSNKMAVIEKLESLGHSYTDGILREELSYVGVPVACGNKQERERLLSELNQAFAIDSWVKIRY